MLLSYQKFEIQPTLINLHPKEYSQEFHYYPFAVKLDNCVESCNILNDLSNKVCVPNVFNMITEIINQCAQHDYRNNKSKTLTKHISY